MILEFSKRLLCATLILLPALGAKDMLQRARERIEKLVAAYQKPELPDDIEKEMNAIMGRYASKYGMAKLPKDP